jgi:hypothetical protein
MISSMRAMVLRVASPARAPLSNGGERVAPTLGDTAQRHSLIGGITWVILNLMKTAVSIPEPLFQAAERLAKRLGVPRSRLYAQAIERYVAEREENEATARLNEIYDKEPAELDPVLATMQWATLNTEKW